MLTMLLGVVAMAGPARAATLEAADPLLAADGDVPLWTVRARNYEAEIGADGSLRLSSGGKVLVDRTFVSRGNDRVTLGRIAKAGDDAIELREGEVAGRIGDLANADDPFADVPDADAPATPGFRLQFKEDAIDVSPLGVPEGNAKGFFTVVYGLGADAVGLVNLRTGVEDALPTTRFAYYHMFSFYEHIGNCWPDVAVVGANGARCELHGIDGVDLVRNHRQYPQELAGELPNGIAVLPPEEAAKPFTMAVSAATGGNLAAIPPATAVPAHRGSIFPADEPARYTLRFDGPAPAGRYRLEWTKDDHIQRPLGEGSKDFEITADDDVPFEIEVDIASVEEQPGYGYAKAWLFRTDVPSARRYFTFEYGRCRLENPGLLDQPAPSNQNDEMYWFNVLGFRGIRRGDSLSNVWLRHRDPDNFETIRWDNYLAEQREVIDYCERGSIKRHVMILEGLGAQQLENYFKETYGKPMEAMGRPDDTVDLDGDAAPADPDKAWKDKRDEVMARWYGEYGAAAQKIGYLWWEPWNEPDLQMPHERYVDTILKPVYTGMKKGGPDLNILGGSCCGLEKQPWVARLYEMGADSYFDGISFHPYTGLGFQRLYRMNLAGWQALFTDHDDDPAQELFITEGACHRGWGYNDYTYDRFGGRRESHAHTGVHMILQAEACGIPRKNVYVFYAAEHGYNDFFLMRRMGPTPSAVAFQVMNECLRDAPFEKEIPLPGRDRFFQRFRDDGRTVAALYTAGDTVTLHVATDAKEVVLTDCMGARSTLVPEDGKVEVTFDNFPVYLQVAGNESLDPAYDGLMVEPNLALSALGATVVSAPEKESGSPDASAILDGDWTGFIGGCWSEPPEGAGPEGEGIFPDIFEIALPGTSRIGSVTVYHHYGAWDRTLRDFDIEVQVDGGWKNVASVRGNYYAAVTSHRFDPVETGRVRLVVTGVNRCLFETIPWIKEQTALRAIEVRAAPVREAKVFFGDTVLAKPATVDGAVTLPYRIVNATDAEVAGELRFTLPEGVSANPAGVVVPARGETTVDVTFQAQGGGVKTILAGFHDASGDLVSSDIEPRWIDVK
ncbi:MAG: hypothetical protein ACOX5G_11025 [Kiritimatiellia bacterium]